MANPLGNNVTYLAKEPDKIVEMASDATPGGIAAFHGMSSIPQNPDDIKPTGDLLGEEYRYMDSARWDMTPRGFSSDPGMVPQQYEQETRLEQPAFMPQPEPEQHSWQQRYGQSENEKGEWRRLAQSQESQMQQLQNQLADLSARVTARGMDAPTYTTPTAPPQPYNLFPQRSPDDAPTVAEINDAITQFAYNEVVPALRDIRTQATNEAYQRALADGQRRYGGWDVTPTEERNVRAKFPWVGSLPPQEQNNLILEHAHALRSTANESTFPMGRQNTPANGGFISPTGARVQPVVVEPQRVIRQQTFIERAAPASVPNDGPTLTRAQLAQRELDSMDVEWQKRGHDRAPATEMKKVLAKHGIADVNDWGGHVLTR